MRVLFLTGEFPPMQGGVGDCTNEIAQALAAHGVDVHVLTSTKAESGKRKDESVHLHPSVKSWDWSSRHVILQSIRDFQPDLVHLQFQTSAFGMHPAIYFLPYFLSHWARVRVTITFHDLRPPYLFPKAGILRDWITRFLARSSAAVIATNGEDLLKLETWNLKQLSLIPIGSNISTTLPKDYSRAAWRAQLGVAENETLLCYFGFLNESKGGEILMRALARVPNAKLLLIGGQVGASDPTNAVYLARVRALIGELGLSERVLWSDFMPQELVTANFIASDLCVMPYRDGASYRRGTLMAALAHGCAIITTTNSQWQMGSMGATRHSPSAIRELPQLVDELNCLLVPPEDPQLLADAINRAIASPELCTRIGVGARELAQHFTWDKIAEQHLEFYRRILQ